MRLAILAERPIDSYVIFQEYGTLKIQEPSDLEFSASVTVNAALTQTGDGKHITTASSLSSTGALTIEAGKRGDVGIRDSRRQLGRLHTEWN